MRYRIIPAILLPALLLAFPTGPGPRRTGGPGDSGHCSGGSCHVGSATREQGVSVYLPGGPYYTPGIPQRILVHVSGLSTEPVTARYGFQFSPRIGDKSGGSVRALDAGVWIQCEDATEPVNGRCPAAWPLQFAQHSRPSRSPVWELEWTPPSAADGPITMYVAGNAANGLGDQIGDRIFLHSLVVHRAGPLSYQSPFGGGGAAPGGWLELYGVGLPGAGATVTIAGIGAEIGYSGKSQINLRVPENAPLGLRMIEVSAPELPPVESPILIQESALTIFPAPPPFRPGEPAELLGTGCGTREQTAELRIAHRGYPARIERRPDEPGLCRIGFQAPDLSPGRYPFHVCIAERCNGQRLEAIVVE